MTKDDSAAATKQDIALLMEQIGTYYLKTEQRIGNLEEALDTKMEALDTKMERWKEEIVDQFHVVAEDLRHDLIGIHKDKIEDHEQRLVRLERQANLRPA